jgi:fermentation-respiration switch protein FrsA (DUF1100 family)
MRRFLRVTLYFLVGFYLVLVFVALFLSDSILFQPPRASYHDGPEVLKLTATDGKRISAIYLENPAAQYTILFTHGNAEDIGDDLPFLEQLRAHGFSVFAVEYHGYGTSEGTPSEKTLYLDEDAAYDYLTGTLHVAPANIIVLGRSVGAGPAVDLAARRPVGGLVVRSGFVSVFRVLTRIPLLPWDEFRNLAKIRRVRCPVLIIHGTSDSVIPFWHGRALFDAAPEPKKLIAVPGADHNDLESVAGEDFYRWLRDFAASLPSSAPSAPRR